MTHTWLGLLLILVMLTSVFVISYKGMSLVRGRGKKRDIVYVFLATCILYTAGGFYIYIENQPSYMMHDVG